MLGWGQTFQRGYMRWRPINCAFYFLFVCLFVFFHVSVNFFGLVLVQQFFSYIETGSPGVWIYMKTQSNKRTPLSMPANAFISGICAMRKYQDPVGWPNMFGKYDTLF